MLIDKTALLAAIEALPDVTPVDSAELLVQIADLKGKLDAANKVVADEEAQLGNEQAKEVDLQASLDAANAKIAAVKAALGV